MPRNTINIGAVTTRLRALSCVMELSILVVDDDELARELIGDRLEERNFKVTYAADGKAALASIESQPVSVALVDWQMPVMDGIEFTEQLRARGVTDTSIIMFTTRDAPIDFERGYDAGVDDYLTKKVSDQELLARIYSGFSTFKLRRALKEAQAALAAATRGKAGNA
jgi:sigma-B regulation protein RsbU (phosphoserine phosphatase)